jgi:hypothetical protein
MYIVKVEGHAIAKVKLTPQDIKMFEKCPEITIIPIKEGK